MFITSEYPPLFSGGIGSVTYELSGELSKQGNEVSVITRGLQPNQYTDENGSRIYRLCSPNIPAKEVLFLLFNGLRIKTIVDGIDPDIICANGFNANLIPEVVRGRNLVITIHGSPQLGEIRANMSNTQDSLRNTLYGLSYLVPSKLTSLAKINVDAFVYVSNFCLWDNVSRIKDVTARKKHLALSHVIYNGINTEEISSIRMPSIEPDRKALVFISRLMEYKGIKYLLKAFKDLAQNDRQLTLNIIGNGPLFGFVKEYTMMHNLEDNIRIHGFLPRKRTMQILAKSALLVHPSFYESFGTVIVEAYALGKPVVVHRAGYAHEMIPQNCGIQVDVTNVSEFSGAIRRLILDSEFYKQCSYSAKSMAKKFDIKTTARQYSQLFRTITEA